LFFLSSKTFDVSVKFPVCNGKHFLRLAKAKFQQFVIKNDIATAGRKFQGMAKKNLIISQFNYSTPNWIYVVLSRATTLEGLFLLQPIKADYNLKPTNLLRSECKKH
jgi:hypothetical protein